MKNIKSKKVISLPFTYLQFVAKNKFRGFNVISILLGIFHACIFGYYYPNKKQPSFILDHFIVGSNMIFSLLIANKIIQENKNKNITIGIFIPKELDYWAYDLVKEEEFINELKTIPFLKDVKKLDEIFIKLVENLNNSNTKIVLLDDRFRISYVEYDKFTESAFFWFDNKKNQVAKNEMYVEDNNKIKNFINKKIKKIMENSENAFNLIWEFENHYKKSNIYETNDCALAISKKTYICSLPQGWLDMEKIILEDRVCYKNDNYALYGTADVLYFNRSSLRKNYLKSFKEMLSQMNLNKN